MERFGITLEIRNFYADAPLAVAAAAPHVVLVPFCYAAEDYTMRDYVQAWPQTRFVNLAWEQVFYPSHEAIKMPRDDFARQRVVHFAWSETFVGYLRANGVDPDNVKLVGHALYGLYRAPYSDYFSPRAALAGAHGLDPARRWVFVPENYRWAFFTDSKLRKLTRHGLAAPELEEMRAYCRRALAALMRWCDALARTGDAEVVLRPRPATNIAEISAFARDVFGAAEPAFRLIKEESAREWVLAADLVASSYSTVLIEGALAGKAILRVEPEPTPAGLRYAWCDLVPSATTEAEFLAASRRRDGARSGAALRAWAESAFFPTADPVDALAQAVAHEVRAAYRRPGAPAAGRNPLPMPRWLSVLAPRLSAKNRNGLFRKYVPGYFFTAGTHEKDLFDAAEVERRFRRWRTRLAAESVGERSARRVAAG
jgi:hypothetical protein